MKKIIFCIFAFIVSPLFSISISDFSLLYKNNKYFNLYDNPEILFEVLGVTNSLSTIETGDSKTYEFDNCKFKIFSLEFETVHEGILYQLETQYNIKNPNHYYSLDYFEVYRDFKTVRGISIGSDIREVLKKYPEAVLYKNNRKYKWEVSDCYWEEKIDNPKKNSDIGYVLLEIANWQYNRSWETDWPMHYELVFIIKDCKVNSIVMQTVLDAK